MDCLIDIQSIRLNHKGYYFIRIEVDLLHRKEDGSVKVTELARYVTDVAPSFTTTPKLKITNYTTPIEAVKIKSLVERSYVIEELKRVSVRLRMVALSMKRESTDQKAVAEEVAAGALVWSLEELLKWMHANPMKLLKGQQLKLGVIEATEKGPTETTESGGDIKCQVTWKWAMNQQAREYLFRKPPTPPPEPVKVPTPEPVREPTPEPEPPKAITTPAVVMSDPNEVKRRLELEAQVRGLEEQLEGEKQKCKKWVDQLLSELDHRTLAVKHVGQELVRTREENSILQAKFAALQQDLKLLESTARHVSAETQDIQALAKNEVINRFLFISHAHQIEVKKTRDLQMKIEQLQEKLIEKNDIEKKFIHMRQAHALQQSYIQRMQESVSKASKYKSIVKKQEAIIRSLEATLSSEPNSSSAKTTESKDEVERLRDRLAFMERTMNQISSGGASSNDIILLMRAEQAEAQVRTLERELVENAKVFAKKLAALQAQSI